MFTLALHTFPERHTAVVLTATAAPAVLGPGQLAELRHLLAAARALVLDGLADRLIITGTGPVFLAGADLATVAQVTSYEEGLRLGQLGHAVITDLLHFPAPTIAYLNGVALGGGLEVALACTARVADAGVTRLGLPEVQLGLVPGWGGCFLLPHLIGPAAAGQIVVSDALRDRSLTAPEAHTLGLVDALLAFDQLGAFTCPRSHVPVSSDQDDDAAQWRAALAPQRHRAVWAAAGGRPAPLRAVELLEAAAQADYAAACEREDHALAELMLTPQLRYGLYAAALQRRARPRPGPPPVTHVGVVGGGLMATQLAALFADAGIAVTLTEVDEASAARARARLAEQGLSPNTIQVGCRPELHRAAELVIEAVSEDMGVKQRVLRDVEAVVSPETVLATNTSALRVTAMGGALERPERLVGMHFFNPVAHLPLVEIVRTASSSTRAGEVAVQLAHSLGKTTVEVPDAPGFIVNRLLMRMLAEVLDEAEHGTPLPALAQALEPIGFPMGPLHLLDLVGADVGARVLTTLSAELGPRYRTSPGLAAMAAEKVRFIAQPPHAPTALNPAAARYFPQTPGDRTAPQVATRVLEALAEEITLLQREGVAERPSIDLAMLTGARWPVHRGGITPYLVELGLLPEGD